jgi:flagellar biosynthesis protein FlhF
LGAPRFAAALADQTRVLAHADRTRAAALAAADPITAPAAAAFTAPVAAAVATPAAGTDAAPHAAALRMPADSAAPPPTARALGRVGDAQRANVVPRSAPPEESYVEMRQELRGLRTLLESELASLSWHDRRAREPLKVRVLEDLSALDIAPDVARRLADLTPAHTRVEDPAHLSVALLAKHLPVAEDRTCIDGGIVAVVGPTGAGKTTSIAKLAALWSLRHRPGDLALVSTDGYRIGAREQLMTYARILGAPMYAANSGKELAQVLERLKSKKLVLIDTAGIGPRDARLDEQLGALRSGAANARVLLALPAQGEAHALDEITGAFAALEPAACILTKLDEAASLGAAMSTVLRHQLPIAYLCNGQRVPEDLHGAYRRRIWLARAAMRLKERTPTPRDEAYLARNFGRGQAHA